jgi:hypothetical protein
METGIIYRSRQVGNEDIHHIRRLIAKNPDKSRYFLSKELCRQWNWRQHNGIVKDMVCRGLLVELERRGLIILPPRKRIFSNPLVHRRVPPHIEIDQTPIEGTLKDIRPIELHSVRRTRHERLYNSLIHEHHYLRYTQPVGENLKYIAFSHGRPIACMGWTSAVRHLKCRDHFIGWSADSRKKNLHLIAYNTRFLILPWVRVSFLCSHLLSLSAQCIARDWMGLYNHPVYFLETFVDTEKFSGTCYRASNWQYLGITTGRGKNDQTHRQNRSFKAVFGYPLHKDFRRLLCR